jgi:hypothetical protein
VRDDPLVPDLCVLRLPCTPPHQRAPLAWVAAVVCGARRPPPFLALVPPPSPSVDGLHPPPFFRHYP